MTTPNKTAQLLIPVLFAILMALLFTNCNKKDKEEKVPVADFTTDKQEYQSGDVLTLVNTSENSSTYRWTLPDGQTLKSENVTYPSTVNLYDEQSFTFKLEAFSESGNKSDFIVKTVKVKGAYGKLVFYSGLNYQYVTITLDNTPYPETQVPFSKTPPPCGIISNFPTFTLTPGTHSIYATGFAGINWTYKGNVMIGAGTCTTVAVP